MTPATATIPAPRQYQRIVVFRALNLGDLLCSVPAFRALRLAHPHAHIALVGLPSAIPFVERFGRYIDELILFPGDPGFPEQGVQPSELPAFYQRMRSAGFDLALQMHGSGQQSNPIVSQFGARHWGGFVPRDGQSEAGRFMTWPDDLPEIKRYLALLHYMGLISAKLAENTALELPLSDADYQEANQVASALGAGITRAVIVHPGARLPSRRWPTQRFAVVADSLAARGWSIAITGSHEEGDLAGELAHYMEYPVVNLCGATSLGGLAGLLRRVSLLICNDTGISHIAAAMHTPSVVIALGSDVARWAPLDHHLHSVVYEPVPCRPCAWHDCPAGHVCALAVSERQVLERADAHLMNGGHYGRH